MKQRHLKLLLALCLAVALLTAGALAAEEPGETVVVGDVELVGSADAPVYAVTDETGTVTPGGSEDGYNVKWDGATLTLQDATIEGQCPYDEESYAVPLLLHHLSFRCLPHAIYIL